MGQLTLKELEGRLDALVLRVDERLDYIDANVVTIGEGFVEVDRLIGELQAQSMPQEGGETPDDIIRAIIEALHGVRLQRAGEMAASLEAKYFPPDDVEEEEGD